MLDLKKDDNTNFKEPSWLSELRSKYLSGESIMFILHSNVLDLVSYDNKYITLKDFLLNELLAKNKDIALYFDTSEGICFATPEMKKKFVTSINVMQTLAGEPSISEYLPNQTGEVLNLFEKIIETKGQSSGIVLGYAETIVQSADQINYLTQQERSNLITFQRWATDPRLLDSDNLIILVTENLSDINQKIVQNPQICPIEIKMPDYDERLEFIRHIIRNTSSVEMEMSIDHLAYLTAGLRRIQIEGLFRQARKTGGKISYQTIIEKKKRIIENECFGMVELIEAKHSLDSLGGMDLTKNYLRKVVKNIKDGNYSRVPMGVLFVGPMGTGKTFAAEAFAGDSGLTCLKLKNFMNSLVGATEANLEKIFTIVKALGSVLIIMDEVDRALGDNKAENDGGTTSRVYAKIKAFMSDTTNRGKILWVVMTNRPDKLDIDLKRSGRFDCKIPFFYPYSSEEVENVIKSLFKKNKLKHNIEDFSQISEKLSGYSGADVEAILLLADSFSIDLNHPEIQENDLINAIEDFIPNRDNSMISLMEHLAIFECSSRQMLPERFKHMESEEINQKIRELKIATGLD